MRITNRVTSAWHEVVQLFFGFSASAAQPDLVLRAFQKTQLLAPSGRSAQICFPLGSRDLSI